MRRVVVLTCLLATVAGCSSGSGETGAPAASPQAEAQTEPQTKILRLGSKNSEQIEGIDVVREYTQQFYRGELEELFAKYSDEMKETLTIEQLRTMHAQVVEQFGEETEVIGEDSEAKGEYRGFARWARFSKHDGVIEVQWILREDDRIAGFFLRPKEPEPAR